MPHTADLIPFGVTGTRLLPVIHMAGFLGDGIPTFEIRTVAGMSDLLVKKPGVGKGAGGDVEAREARRIDARPWRRSNRWHSA